MFLGSAFSPAYARARRRGAADPLDHAAVNLCVYDRRAAWAFTERPKAAVRRDSGRLQVGPTTLAWEGDTLVLRFRERRAPLGGTLSGTVALHPSARHPGSLALDPGGHHLWYPVAPAARAEVHLDAPARRFEGDAYHDANAGDRALEADLDGWRWHRRPLGAGRTQVVYDTFPRGGAPRLFAGTFDARRGLVRDPPPAPAALPVTGWGLDRSLRLGAPAPAAGLRTLEDTPFYARTRLTLGGPSPGLVIAESVDLARFRARWVRLLLRFRMRREGA